jgi:glucosamine--fructose-6-phosphate aminotransferase (isomerizing)
MIALRLGKAKGTLSLSDSICICKKKNSGESKRSSETNDRAKEIATAFKDAPNCLYLGRVIIFPLHLSFKA